MYQHERAVELSIVQILIFRDRSQDLGAQSFSVLGVTLTRAGKPASGEPYLREALEIRRKVLPAGHGLTANMLSQLGEFLTAQKRFAEAEPLLKEGYEGLKKVLGEKDPRTAEAIQRLVQFYDATRKTAEAARYRAILPAK